ncbi:endonuclease domain-containing protein [Geodermatophilus sp. SYSU D00079]
MRVLDLRHGGVVPRVPLVPHALRTEPFRGSHAVRSRLLTARQLRGDTWRRLLHDVYVHRDVPVTHGLRARAATILLPDAVVTGRSAAVLWGVDLTGPRDDVEVTAARDTHQVRVEGLVVRRATLDPAHVRRRDDVPVSSPEATAVRLAAALPRDDAVAAVDQLIATGVVDLEPVRALAARTRGPGSARARDVAALADGRAESPQETRVRLLIGRSTLPPPVAQFRVFDGPGFVARVDFAWPDRRVAVEYDGLWHAEARQFARDRERLNRLQGAGWRVVFVTAADLREPDRLIARIRSTLTASAR